MQLAYNIVMPLSRFQAHINPTLLKSRDKNSKPSNTYIFFFCLGLSSACINHLFF